MLPLQLSSPATRADRAEKLPFDHGKSAFFGHPQLSLIECRTLVVLVGVAGACYLRVVHRALDQLPVRHAFVILDCCYAGQYWRAAQRGIPEPFTKLGSGQYNRYTDSAAWQLLTAASGDQVAIDNWPSPAGWSHGGHSPFTAALLDGLKGEADYTKDGLITASELAMFVQNRVANTLEPSAVYQSPQLFPLCRHDKGEFVFRAP